MCITYVHCYYIFFFLLIRRPPRATRTDTLFPYTTLFRSTGRIDEDARRPALPVGQHRRFLPGIAPARLDAGRNGAFGAWRQLLETRAGGVAGEDVGVVVGERRDGDGLIAPTRDALCASTCKGRGGEQRVMQWRTLG